MSAGRWLLDFGGEGDPLVFFPPAGSMVSSFRRDLAPFGAWQVMAVALPGRERRRTEAPPGSLALAASAIAAEVRALGRPSTFVGFSFGAHLALAVAQRLQGTAAVVGIVALGAIAPGVVSASRPRLHSTMDDQALLEGLLSMGLAVVDGSRHSDRTMTMLIERLRVDLELLEGASWGDSPIAEPIVAVLADDDPFRGPGGSCAGWAEWTTTHCELHTIKGDHYSYLRPPNVDIVERLLSRARNA